MRGASPLVRGVLCSTLIALGAACSGSSQHATGTAGAAGNGGVVGSGGVATGGHGGQVALGGGGASGGTAGTSAIGGSAGTSVVGGSGGAIGTGGLGAGGTFPLSVSTNKRYVVGADGKPFLVAGDSPQCLSANLSPKSMDGYFAARAAQGFNASWVNLLCTTYTGGRANATTYDGIAPFLGGSSSAFDLTKPNPAYFARVDALVAAAAAHGTVVFLDPIETGGFKPTLTAASDADALGYGRYLAGRYKSRPNIVWMSGNDLAGYNQIQKVVDVALGIRDGGATQLQTAELDWPALSSTLDDPDWVPPNAPTSLDLAYTYNPTYALLLHDYNRSGFMPNIFIEGNYEGENLEGGPHLTNAHDVRAQAYWSDLSGATGYFYGNHWEVYALDDSSWQGKLAGDQGAPQMVHVKELFESRAWWALVPDQTHQVLTAGLGTCMATEAPQGGSSPNAQDNDCAVAARTGDGTLVIAYLPSARNVTVDLSKLAGGVVARWFDPTTGTYSSIAGSPFVNSGTHVFSPPSAKHSDGTDDCVLVLEKAP